MTALNEDMQSIEDKMLCIIDRQSEGVMKGSDLEFLRSVGLAMIDAGLTIEGGLLFCFMRDEVLSAAYKARIN